MVGCILFSTKNMAVKVLVTQIGQQIVSETKQVENKETGDIVGYWLTQPRVVNYTKDEEGNIGVNFTPYCLVSDEAEFSVRAEHVVAILEPRADVAFAQAQPVLEVPRRATRDFRAHPPAGR